MFCEGCGHPFFKGDKAEIPELPYVIKGHRGKCPNCNKKLDIDTSAFKVS